MKRMLKKLRSKAGESLVEVLCAVLIFALSSVAMYSMVMAANNINADAKKADREFQENMLVVEMAEDTDPANPPVQGTVKMSFAAADGEIKYFEVPVQVYQKGDLYSYFRTEGGAE